jgi:hypothetical protein
MQPTETQNRKPGRPAKLGAPMSDKMRAATYRMQRRELASMAHENLTAASTPVLLAGLALQIKSMTDANHSPTARDVAAAIINELCERHKIKLTRSPGAI